MHKRGEVGFETLITKKCNKAQKIWITYIRGSQPFFTLLPPIQNWTLLRTPKMTFNPFCVPFVGLFDTNLISAYPLQTSCVPLGVRVPQVENRWPRSVKRFPTQNPFGKTICLQNPYADENYLAKPLHTQKLEIF